MTKTLITGANGFIGSRLCSKLSLSGRNIKKLVRTSNINDQFVETFNKYTKEDKENSPSKSFQDPPLSMREKYI